VIRELAKHVNASLILDSPAFEHVAALNIMTSRVILVVKGLQSNDRVQQHLANPAVSLAGNFTYTEVSGLYSDRQVMLSKL
jgi:hypothetical protein